MAAVCHMTSMTRRHGNNKVIQSKITVAWKKLTLGAQLEYFKLRCERVKSDIIGKIKDKVALKHIVGMTTALI